jgi:hypothetical protein
VNPLEVVVKTCELRVRREDVSRRFSLTPIRWVIL